MERLIENTMYAARWLLAPIYFGLAFALLAILLLTTVALALTFKLGSRRPWPRRS